MTQDSTTPATAWPYPPGADASSAAAWLVEPIPERTAAIAIGTALVGGVVAQALFFGHVLGINFALWIAFVLGAAFVARRRVARVDRWDAWLAPTAVLFASFGALRDESMLLLFDFVAACLLTLAAAVALSGHHVTRSVWRRLVRLGAIGSALYVAGAPFLSPGLGPIARAARRDRASRSWRLVRGLLIALPLVLLFGALFVAADAVFARLVGDIVSFDLARDVVPRLALAGIAAWLLAGTITVAWMSRPVDQPDEALRPRREDALGTLEARVVLLVLNAMFALFAIVQAAYLFGGADTLALTGISYSEYARRGFFELIAVAALAGSVIVGLARLVATRDLVFRVLACLLAAAIGLVLASALYRLALYQAAYGWTELRFYAVAAIAWLATGVIAMVVLVTIDRVPLLGRVMLTAGMLVALACNAIGPQSFVTEQNVARAVDPRLVPADGYSGLDVEYLWSLGSDSVRVLVASVDRLAEPERSEVEQVLRVKAHTLSATAAAGWPSWNLAREFALRSLRAAGY